MKVKQVADELIEQSEGLIEQAERYKAEIEDLPAGDPARAKLEKLVEDLLDRSLSISATVQKMLK